MSDWFDVAPADGFPPGTFHTVDADGVAIAVFNVEGRYYAIEDMCSHEAETLSGGEVLGECIVCPRHGASFSLRTGEALGPPAYEPVATFPVRVEQGMVQVRDDRFD
ncbi:non-heme iron oxygenase ferredoxin subunit [Pseudogulbenkiania subflava]|uniref:3-phenylpropionate/trans-cinnamate dioxygenase ferredoxin subunit n=1 Tax=Pseudogulbenkiania subflava DSM 22618 TaxID=1123014 RepID=A0A1Y6C706_9NEIS|nr:non-heme iron oxygenase ferredoxin subunit [Pseudogulbenkiania subflava]SMF48620.1 3-phenylpropionate/trans-cinnamate dioxygenase ferredoxin subunit [Pseudogulbenkiania subflava DSM 22618]